jgi:hypothetical protein
MPFWQEHNPLAQSLVTGKIQSSLGFWAMRAGRKSKLEWLTKKKHHP